MIVHCLKLESVYYYLKYCINVHSLNETTSEFFSYSPLIIFIIMITFFSFKMLRWLFQSSPHIVES